MLSRVSAGQVPNADSSSTRDGEDLHAYAGAEYETPVGAFLTEHLRTQMGDTTRQVAVAPASSCLARPA